MPIEVHLSGYLKEYTKNKHELHVPDAEDVLDLVAQLDRIFPSIIEKVLDEHLKVRPWVNIFVNEKNIRDLHGELTKLNDRDVIYILPSIAGG